MNNIKLDSLGKLLVKARKLMNFKKKDIANKLCLKLNIIDSIENDKIPNNISLVFFCGYIRSYARLVRLPEEKIICFLDKYKSNYFSNEKNSKKSSYFKNNYFFYIKIFVFIKLLFLLTLGFFYFKNRVFENNKNFVFIMENDK